MSVSACVGVGQTPAAILKALQLPGGVILTTAQHKDLIAGIDQYHLRNMVGRHFGRIGPFCEQIRCTIPNVMAEANAV